MNFKVQPRIKTESAKRIQWRLEMLETMICPWTRAWFEFCLMSAPGSPKTIPTVVGLCPLPVFPRGRSRGLWSGKLRLAETGQDFTDMADW